MSMPEDYIEEVDDVLGNSIGDYTEPAVQTFDLSPTTYYVGKTDSETTDPTPPPPPSGLL